MPGNNMSATRSFQPNAIDTIMEEVFAVIR